MPILRPAVTPDGPKPVQVPSRPDLAAVHPDGVGAVSVRWEDDVEPDDPCPGCGGLLFWWNAWGDQRCMACDPPTTAIRLLETTERIRRRNGIPSPTGAAEMLADLKRITYT